MGSCPGSDGASRGPGKFSGHREDVSLEWRGLRVCQDAPRSRRGRVEEMALSHERDRTVCLTGSQVPLLLMTALGMGKSQGSDIKMKSKGVSSEDGISSF